MDDEKYGQLAEFDGQDPIADARQRQILNMTDDERHLLEQQLRQASRHYGMEMSYPVYVLRDAKTWEMTEPLMSLFEVEEWVAEQRVCSDDPPLLSGNPKHN